MHSASRTLVLPTWLQTTRARARSYHATDARVMAMRAVTTIGKERGTEHPRDPVRNSKTSPRTWEDHVGRNHNRDRGSDVPAASARRRPAGVSSNARPHRQERQGPGRTRWQRPEAEQSRPTSHYDPTDVYQRSKSPRTDNSRRQSWKPAQPEEPAAPPSPSRRAPFTPGPDPYMTSTKLQKYLSRRSSPPTASELEMAEQVIKAAPRPSVNVVVWNVLLQAFGRARAYAKMFKLFNDMKKMGVQPSARTFTIMLSHYSKTLGAPSERTIARATLLFDQSQRYMQSLLPGSTGLEGLASGPAAATAVPPPRQNHNPELTVAPTNAYLTCLSHFGDVDEMMRVFRSMPMVGPTSPDAYTYSIVFGGLLKAEDAGTRPKEVWERLEGQVKVDRKALDGAVAVLALRCFTATMARFGVELLGPLYGLSLPGRSMAAAANADVETSNLPRLKLDERAAETALKLCLAAGKPSIACHVADQILDDEALASTLHTSALNAILAAYGGMSEAGRCVDLLGEDRRWNEESYVQVLKALAGKGDWDRAERAWALRSGREAAAPSARLLGLLIRTAINSGRISAMRRAWRVYNEAGKRESRGAGELDRSAAFWEAKLRQDVSELADRLLKAPRGAKTGLDEREEVELRKAREARIAAGPSGGRVRVV